MMRRVRFLGTLVPALLLMFGLLSMPALAAKGHRASKPKIFAQKLVEAAISKHPEVTGVELAVGSSRECSTIADSELEGVGEKCDHDELEAMRTGEPFVEEESDGFDVTLPLRDSTGKIIGTVSVDFEKETNQTRSSVVERAMKIAQEVEAQAPSTEKLLEPVD